jgi:hypothetical protein
LNSIFLSEQAICYMVRFSFSFMAKGDAFLFQTKTAGGTETARGGSGN